MATYALAAVVASPVVGAIINARRMLLVAPPMVAGVVRSRGAIRQIDVVMPVWPMLITRKVPPIIVNDLISWAVTPEQDFPLAGVTPVVAETKPALSFATTRGVMLYDGPSTGGTGSSGAQYWW